MQVTEIFLEIIRETRDFADDNLTPEEQRDFDRLMMTPEMQRIVSREPIYSTDVLTSQLEMVLQKKRSEKDHSEQIIRGVSLHDSIIDKEIITQVNDDSHVQQNQMYGEPPLTNKVFNYVKGFDLHNEMRPVKK